MIAAREVTQAQFELVMGYNPAFQQDSRRCPVESVSAHEAAAYCNGLSRAEGRPECYECTGERATLRCKARATPRESCAGYRLPSEEEWEVAARGGTLTAVHSGTVQSCMSRDEEADEVGWYKSNSDGQPHPVGKKRPNALGLYDMSGNVFEWTESSFPDGSRVLRGGSWYHNAEHLRVAGRFPVRAELATSYAGLRCARSTDR